MTLAHHLGLVARELGCHVDADNSDLLAPHPAEAAFSEDRTYRYLLTRTWSTDDPAVFVMLNPSTADAFDVDPTVRRCLGFARAWGAGGLIVLNIFALRSTDPKALYDADPAFDPVGPLNDPIIDAVPVGPKIVAAWGAHGGLASRGQTVADALAAKGHSVMCLGRTDKGSPRHPLYLRRTTKPLPYGEVVA